MEIRRLLTNFVTSIKNVEQMAYEKKIPVDLHYESDRIEMEILHT